MFAEPDTEALAGPWEACASQWPWFQAKRFRFHCWSCRSIEVDGVQNLQKSTECIADQNAQPAKPHGFRTAPRTNSDAESEYEGMKCSCWHTGTYRDSIITSFAETWGFLYLIASETSKKDHPVLPTGSVVMRARRSGMGVCWQCTSWEGKKWQEMCDRKVLLSCDWSTLSERFWNFAKPRFNKWFLLASRV